LTMSDEIVILNVDALEGFKLISDNTVDLIVTDPPYCSDEFEWDKKTVEWQLQWLCEAKRVLKPGRYMYVFFAPMNMYEVEGWFRREMKLKNLIVWYHPDLHASYKSYGRDRWKSSWDVVFYAQKPGNSGFRKNVSQCGYLLGGGLDVQIYPRPRPLLHKAQKPLELILKFISASSHVGELVLDPFVGSGTTALACKYLRRRFIGFEIDEKLVELSYRRLEMHA